MHEIAQRALERVQLKADYLVDIQVWPPTAPPVEFNPKGWLANFSEQDLPYAALMLDAFLFFSERITDELFRSSVRNLSNQFAKLKRSTALANWREFLDTTLFCGVCGEKPRTTDSGHLFARKARQLLEISDDNIVSPDECCRKMAGPEPWHAVVFVDDLVGSGAQFCTMWSPSSRPPGSASLTFAELSGQRSDVAFYYCPILATETGCARIRQECPALRLLPAHILEERVSPMHPRTRVFPDELRGSGQEMIERLSRSLGIPDLGGNSANDWRGFNQLATCVAFAHGVPDTTLRLFTLEQHGWTPLVKRR